MLERKIASLRIRGHGDYHLGQVLWTGKDFVIIDFEGEPNRTLAERRFKHSALRDVAGMLRSFHYAAHASLFAEGGDRGWLEHVASLWYRWAATAFLGSYLEVAEEGTFISKDREELGMLLDLHLLEKAIYELGYELSHRPDWVRIPLRGILEIVAPR